MVVFDLDGTLVDTLPDIAGAFNRVFVREGFPVHPVSSFRDFVGWGLRRTLELSLPTDIPDDEFEEILKAVINEYERAPALLSLPYQGIPELLEKLFLRNIPAAVFTNKDQQIAEKIIRELLPGACFIQVLGAVETRPLKPDPQGIHELKSRMQNGNSPVLMVGDTPIDYKTSINSAVDFCGVLWGYRSEEELRAAGSAENVRTPHELYNCILAREEKDYDQ